MFWFKKLCSINVVGKILIISTIIIMTKPHLHAQLEGFRIGNVSDKACCGFEGSGEAITITGSGRGLLAEVDDFFFVCQKSAKNVILSCQMDWLGREGSIVPRGGIIFRENLSSHGRYVALSQDATNRLFLSFRQSLQAPAEEILLDTFDHPVFWMEKRNGKVQVKVGSMGKPLKLVGEFDLGIDPLYYGQFVASGSDEQMATARFFNVRTYFTAPENFVPYRDYIGSQLEILDISTGVRHVIYRTKDPIEAPNWTPDGKALIFNSRGLLFRLELGQTTPQPIPTGFATSNNNDHGISPDGQWLAISHHDAQLPAGANSVIYIVPIAGGIPRRITTLAPSYWHGWSPDGKWLVYTAKRNNRWNIYKIPVNGGDEIQLTDNESLNDGPEFSPDGKFIWFNSNRTGRMQIWRMKPDGSEQTQMTHDEFNNWFPHPSPDGKWVIFLSYLPDVNPWDHPYYREVMLQIMRPDGSDKRIIAYLYGGQGTINVPSWSPDGQRVAFVSHTDISE